MLEDYEIVYEVTALPTIIFAQKTKANEPLYFEENLEIPESIKGLPVECRISIYKDTGELVELSSEIMPAAGFAIKKAVNITPLKMIEKLVNQIVKDLQSIKT